MKKTIHASVGRTPFVFEEDAFEALSNYLKKIEFHFSKTLEHKEITEDVELRIAELLLECSGRDKVVGIKDVDIVIKRMGSAEDITGHTLESNTQNHYAIRRLFRDSDNRMLGGVCSGLGAYLGIDFVWIRLFWLILFLFFGTGFLLYLILWIVIPEAKTPTEKLQMYGKPVNIEELKKIIHQKVRGEMDNFKKNESGPLREFINQIIRNLNQFFRKIFRFMGVLFALGAIIFTFLVVFLFLNLIGGEWLLMQWGEGGPEFTSFSQFIAYIFPSKALGWVTFLTLAVFFGIPLLMLVVHSVRYIMKWTGSIRLISIPAVSLWIISMAVLTWAGIRLSREFRVNYSEENMYQWYPPYQPVSLEMKLPDVPDGHLVVSDVKLHLFRNFSDTLWRITIKRGTLGSSRTFASALISNIDFMWKAEGNKFELPAAVVLPPGSYYRGQNFDVFIYVPTGHRLILNSIAAQHLAHVPNAQKMEDWEMAGHNLEMTAYGLSCLDCH